MVHAHPAHAEVIQARHNKFDWPVLLVYGIIFLLFIGASIMICVCFCGDDEDEKKEEEQKDEAKPMMME